MFDMASIDEGALKAAGLKNLKQRNPVHARRFHHDRGDPTGCSPVGEAIHIAGKGTKFLDRLGITVCRHTDPMLLRSSINACGMGMYEGHVLGRGLGLLAFVGQVPPVRVRKSKRKQGSFCIRIQAEGSCEPVSC
jgi:hypothetical protein